jgi:hypothetical protein
METRELECEARHDGLETRGAAIFFVVGGTVSLRHG